MPQSASQSVSYFTVPPHAHPSTGSQSGSATPGLTQSMELPLIGRAAPRSSQRLATSKVTTKTHQKLPSTWTYVCLLIMLGLL